jgi:transposase-like protein
MPNCPKCGHEKSWVEYDSQDRECKRCGHHWHDPDVCEPVSQAEAHEYAMETDAEWRPF